MAAAAELTGRLVRSWIHLDGPGRLAGIDLARGLAVMGMFAAHLIALPDFSWSDPATWLDVASGRSSILFATLAGVSIGLVTGGRTPVAGAALQRARVSLGARAGLIWVLGILLMATGVPVYVILPAYGILFVLTLPFLPLRSRALFAIAAALAVVMPFVQVVLGGLPVWETETGALLDAVLGWHYPFTVWIAFVLCGLGIGRLDLRSARVGALLLAAGATLAVVGYGLAAISGPGSPFWNAVWTDAPHSSGLLEVAGSGGFAMGVIGLCLLVCRTPLRWIALPLRAVGSMPLTAYTAQLVVWAIIAAAVLGDPGDLSGFRALEPFWPMVWATLIACTAWALLIGRGPLEWIVARVTAAAGRSAAS
ncbi:MAG TPA: heparan-alpha-glucosaminide N-acetyltransferase domain-containing protein [Microbacterium sp.]|nr:heparan-alpha-glucosaminide N-acetyltransferase domain-containing protein [Microbacterium sp.]